VTLSHLPPVGKEKNCDPEPSPTGGEGKKLIDLPQPARGYQPFRRKAGTGDLFRLSRRKSCLRMPHSPDRTATTAGLVHPNRSVVPVHFDGLPSCPIRLRVPHPSSFPRESGIGRPGTAGDSAFCQSGKPDRRQLVPLLFPPTLSHPPPGGREKNCDPEPSPTGGEGKNWYPCPSLHGPPAFPPESGIGPPGRRAEQPHGRSKKPVSPLLPPTPPSLPGVT
jgi:hypothetical protein